MKRVIYVLTGFFIMGILAYILGPKPPKPTFSDYNNTFPDDLSSLKKIIDSRESEIGKLREDNNAKVIFNNEKEPKKTEYAIVYIHGFSASEKEGDPVHRNLAKKLNANLYLARLVEHGINDSTESLRFLTADRLVNSAEEALAIAKKLGNKVIVIGTSMGGALSLYLASKHPEINCLLLYSPCIEIYDKSTRVLNDPWGLQIARAIVGKDYRVVEPKNELQRKYWTMEYRLEALVALEELIESTMLKKNFEKIKCPVFLAYYYKDEENQDKVVSVAAMLKMFDELGSTTKTKEAFPNTNNHVVASYIMSDDFESVQKSSEKFLDSVFKEGNNR